MPLAKNNGWKWYLVKLFIILFMRCLSLGGFSYRALCSPPPPPPPFLHSFSDFTFEEVVGVEEPVHWEAPLEGKLDSEVPQVKELS